MNSIATETEYNVNCSLHYNLACAAFDAAYTTDDCQALLTHWMPAPIASSGCTISLAVSLDLTHNALVELRFSHCHRCTLLAILECSLSHLLC